MHRLISTQQATHSVTEYAVKFQTLAAESGWNDKADQGVFYKGLQDAVEDELETK